MKTICYCFGYTDLDIIRDVVKNKGESLIAKRIIAARSKGECQCELKNPAKT